MIVEICLVQFYKIFSKLTRFMNKRLSDTKISGLDRNILSADGNADFVSSIYVIDKNRLYFCL